jgi:hypothetical protein
MILPDTRNRSDELHYPREHNKCGSGEDAEPLRSPLYKVSNALPFAARSRLAMRSRPPKTLLSGAKNRFRRRAFAGLPNRLPEGLKNHQKIPFIQQLADRDFALGAMPLSWQK